MRQMDRAARPSKIVLRAFGGRLAGNVGLNPALPRSALAKIGSLGEIKKIDARFSARQNMP
jgi:hypothetical protein